MDTRSSHERESGYDDMLRRPALAKHPHLLVVIDHREARVYRTELYGTVPQRLTPYDPYGYGRQLHYVRDGSKGLRKPERENFYAAVAGMLQAVEAEAILFFGHGTGASSAMNQLLAELKQHHAGLAKRVVGAIVVDQPNLTEDQLLAKARECYANAGL